MISEKMITEKIGQLSVPSRLGAKTSLDPIKALMDQLDHPERKFRSIHVGGTSGKGSTSTFLANILSDAGYKVGLFTKPHLESVCERMMINGIPIRADEIMALLERIGNAMAEKPTWFELTTAVAFQYFADQQVDFGVVEVGLGGRFDATNIIQPELSILTNVGLDHTDILGSTIEKIAMDKVGIFKPGRPVISGVVQPTIIKIVEDQCLQVQAGLKLMGLDFRCTNIVLDDRGSSFDFEMMGQSPIGLAVSMIGNHQVLNASVAAAAALELGKDGAVISIAAIQSGLKRTQVPGRMEILRSSPTVLLDGAHSPPKMEALAEGLHTLFAKKKDIIGVLSFSKGHDARETLMPLLPFLGTAILTEFNVETDYGNKRAQPAEEVAALVRELNADIRLFLEPNPALAIEMALGLAAATDLVCVTGSIYLVGQVRKNFACSMPYSIAVRENLQTGAW
jgi:dihydrofolate synthase / folylpolyglutamate synthase